MPKRSRLFIPSLKDEEEEKERLWRQYLRTASLSDTSKQKSPKAAQALAENKRSKPKVKYTGNTGKRNSTVSTYTNNTVGTEVQVKDTPNPRRGRTRDVAFRDTGAEGYNQRGNRGTPADRQLRSAVVQDQISRAIPAQRSGDRITADPTSAGRARLYGQQGPQFASSPDRAGNPTINTQTLRSGNTVNAAGQKGGPINLEQLRIPLQRQAISRVVGMAGPYGRALSTVMEIDNFIKATTGQSGYTRWNQLVEDTMNIRPVKPTSGFMGF